MVNSLFQWLLLGFVSIAHPFFVSMTDINHNVKEQTLEISVRIFTDDFEKVLKKNNNVQVDFTKPKDKAAVDKMITAYIGKNLLLTIDGKKITPTYIGYEIQEASVWSYFEVKQTPTVKKIDVINTLLYDFNEKQINLHHVKMNGKEKSYKLDYPNNNTSFIW
jgi:hypothetical protein